MTMSGKSEPQKTSGPQECAGCGKKIQDRYLLKAIDMFWHEDCLKCGCCDCRLGEVGSRLYTKGNLILCKRDYLRLFGTTGYCSACNKVIPAFEMVMRAKTNIYHLECFACQQCNHRFCVGDRFFFCDNKILCEYDYEERMVFANLAYNSSNLAQLKQQARSVNGHPGMKQEMPLPPMNPGCPPSMSAGCSGMSSSPQMNGQHHNHHLHGGGPPGMMSHNMSMQSPMGPPGDMMGRGIPSHSMAPCSSNPNPYSMTSSPATSVASNIPLPPISAPQGPLPSIFPPQSVAS